MLTVYTCHGHWQDNQTTFIIAKHAGSQHGVCISYKPNELNTAQLIIGDSCYRPSMVQSIDHRLVANLTVFGEWYTIDTFHKYFATRRLWLLYHKQPNLHWLTLFDRNFDYYRFVFFK